MSWLAFLILSVNLIFPVLDLGQTAQASVEFKDVSAQVTFGEAITFHASLTPSAPVQSTYLTVKPQDAPATVYAVETGEDGQMVFRLDVKQDALRPFSHVVYSFKVILASGEEAASPDYSFDYNDTRFQWQTLEDGNFQVFWYDRNPAFGQKVLNTAASGLKSAGDLLAVKPAHAVSVYVYNSARDLQGALVDSQAWVAGHASPDLGVILVSIPSGPEESLELERQVPHELMHILQYQKVGGKFTQQPVWLMEGMASDTELYPNPEYSRVLTQSASTQKLLPMESLCSIFPRDASSAYLAYAQSASFVHFLFKNYGASGILKLIENYQNGLGCAEGIDTAFGATLNQLEYRWKQEELNMNPESLILRNLLPYILIFVVVFGAAAFTIVLASRK